MDDPAFVTNLEHWYGDAIYDHYPSKIAGVLHLNRDGTDRQTLIRECCTGDLLALAHEPDNPVDPKAVAVKRHLGGKQLGYLPWRTAQDLLLDLRNPELWCLAVFRGHYYCGDDMTELGALIHIVKFDRAALARRRVNLANHGRLPGIIA